MRTALVAPPERWTAPRSGAVRVMAVVFALAAAWYVGWLATNLDLGQAYLAVPFLLATLLVVASLVVTSVNNWTRKVPPPLQVVPGTEPMVGCIIPTCGEPVWQLEATALSVLKGDWPLDKLLLVISDDARSDEVRHMVDGLRRQVPGALVHYHRPAPRGHEVRGAAAKAGNLNSAVEVLRFAPERVEVIETRDCDDLVADPQFLRWAVAQLVADPKTAYVQSVKWARVADGDPFGNLQPHFYLGAMHARYAANAVFPCGSGVVWRREALSDIGGFPDWNLVEDLQSGWEALKRGWRGAYIPIVGAMGQTAPEDVAVVYKQRGTWALDTIRLLLFERMRGMTVRQRLHFAELGLFYAQSLTTLVFIAVLAAVLAGGAQPVQTDLHGFLVHFLPFGIALELLLYALHRPFGGVWRAREMWTGLTPVFAKAWWLAIRFGPHRKPSYEVTRKEHVHTWYWRETLPQVALLLVSVGAALVTLYDGEVTAWDAWSAWWALLYGAQLAAFVRKSAHGVVFTRPGVRAADGRTIAAVTP